jgi:hypothetical protein
VVFTIWSIEGCVRFEIEGMREMVGKIG